MSIANIVDLDMGTVAYNSLPETTLPPEEIKTYKYPVKDLVFLPSDISSLEGKVDKLSEESESKRFSDLTKIKMASALGVMLSLASLSLTVITCANPFIIAISSVAFGALGIYSAYQFVSSFMSIDLENSSTRCSLRNSFNEQNLAEILSKYSFDELVGYDLLKDKAEQSAYIDRNEYYALVKAFQGERQRIIQLKEADTDEVLDTFYKKTQKIQSWFHKNLSFVQYSDNKFQFKNTMIVAIKIGYKKRMAPWRAWKEQELSSINQAYKVAEEALNQKLSHS